MEHPRRTVKLLFAIARGIYVLNPAWLMGSLARRQWLPNELFDNQTFVECRATMTSKVHRHYSEEYTYSLTVQHRYRLVHWRRY